MTPEEIYARAQERMGMLPGGTTSPTTSEFRTMNSADPTAEIYQKALGTLHSERDWQGNRMAHTQEMGVLMSILDVLSRGQYGVVGAVQAIRHDKPIGEEIVKGLKGETKGSWIDIVEEVVPGRHPWVEKPVGFLGDVIVDPINLVPIAWMGQAARLFGITKMFKHVDDITKTTKILNRAGAGMREAVSQIGFMDRQARRFIPGWDLKKVTSIDPQTGKIITAYDKYRDLQLQLNNIRRVVQEEFIQRWDHFRKTAKVLGQDPDRAAAQLIKLREAGLADEVHPAFQSFYDDIVVGLDKLAKDETTHGLFSEKAIKENYFPHIFEKGEVIETAGGELMVKKQKGFYTKLQFRHAPFFTKPREFKTIEEAKRAIKEWRGDGIMKEIAPIDNWFRGYAIRRFVGESSIAWKNFVDETLQTFGTHLNPVFEEAVKKAKGMMQPEMSPDELLEVLKLHGIELERGMSLVTATTNLKAPSVKGMLMKGIMKDLREAEERGLMEVLEAADMAPNESLYQIFKKTRGKGVIELDLKQAKDLTDAAKGVPIYALPSEYAKEIKQTFKVFSTDESTKGFLRSIDGATHVWKSMATSMRVPFHMRNAISNAWLMYLGGVSAPKIAMRAVEALRIQLGKGGINGFSAKEINEMANRFGIRAYGWMGADVPQMLQKELHIIEARSTIGRKLGAGDVPLFFPQSAARLGRKAGTYVEDNARLAVFIDQMKKLGIRKGAKPTALPRPSMPEAKAITSAEKMLSSGMWREIRGGIDRPYKKDLITAFDETAEGGMKAVREARKAQAKFLKERRGLDPNVEKIDRAAKHVKKYLFDYTELTDFERRVMKRIFPFYTWMRKNIPLQLTNVVTQPHKYARLGDFQKAFWPDTAKGPTEEEAMKYHWMQEENFRRTPWETEGGMPIYYKIDLPTEELNKMWRLKTWISALTPVATMAQIAMNVRTWPEVGKLAEPGMKERAPFYFQWAPEWLQKYAGVEPVVNRTTRQLELGMHPQWKYALKTAFPFLNDWEAAYPQAGSLVAGSDSRELGLLSYGTGIKWKPLDVKQAAMSAAFKMQKAKRQVRRAKRKRPRLTAEEARGVWEDVLKGK